MASADLERGRDAYGRRAWRSAYDAFVRADASDGLGADDLDLFATCAYLIGRDDESMAYFERAHHRFLEEGDERRAVRCAFWLGMNLLLRGEIGPASGWLGRAERMLDRDADSAEHGYLLLPEAFQLSLQGDLEGAAATAGRAGDIGERFGDADLFALASGVQGQFLVGQGQIELGLRLLDEAMVAATSPEAGSPIVTGIVYCGVILSCVETYQVRRAQEWTDVLTRWCEEQPELVAFTGRCLIHRAEIMQLHGAWSDALEEARRASARLSRGFNRGATAQAFYRQGELERLRGDLEAAEQAYEEARRYGFEPQPGSALLRLAQAREEAAVAAIRRVLGEATDRPRRAGLLPAFVEIALAVGDVDEAAEASRELEQLAEEYASTLLRAAAAQARGAVELAREDPAAALASLRRSWHAWHELEAPYEAARARALLGLACRLLGDEDTALRELEAARDAFVDLGAHPDRRRVESWLSGSAALETHGLTARELEVLRLVAAGKTNRDIATALVISEHTVARHLQNVFAKLDVSSRTAASAFAYEHDLV